MKADFQEVFRENRVLSDKNTLVSNDNIYLCNKVHSLTYLLTDSQADIRLYQNQLEEIFKMNANPEIDMLQSGFQKISNKVVKAQMVQEKRKDTPMIEVTTKSTETRDLLSTSE